MAITRHVGGDAAEVREVLEALRLKYRATHSIRCLLLPAPVVAHASLCVSLSNLSDELAQVVAVDASAETLSITQARVLASHVQFVVGDDTSGIHPQPQTG